MKKIKKETKNSVIKKTKKIIENITNTKKETKYVKIPLVAAIFFGLFLCSASFFLGSMIIKPSTGETKNAKETFAVDKTDKPEFDFFVMSFCPYGNMMEDTLKPVFDLIGSKVDLRPRYIFSKIEGGLGEYCKSATPDPTNCETYVKNSQGQLKDVNDCKQQIAKMVTECNDEKQYLKIGNNFYSSLHGRVEANQDVREICAYNLSDDKKSWWNFVDNVNKSCTAQNADSCWEEQAKKAGLDTAKITDCFNKDAATLIDKEIALTDQYKVQGSPTLLVNGKNFPPENADPQATPGDIKVGNKVFTQAQLRSSDAIKEAICSAFKKSPKECKTVIADPTAAAAATGDNNGAAAAAAPAGSCN